MYSIAHERKTFYALGNYLKFLPQLVDSVPKKRTVVDLLNGDDSDAAQDLYYTINGALSSFQTGNAVRCLNLSAMHST